MLISIYVRSAVRCKPKDRQGADNLFDNDTTFLDISHTVWAAHDPKDKRGILGPPGAPPSVSNHSPYSRFEPLVMPTLPLRMASYRAITTGHSQSTFRPQSSRLAIQARYHSQHSRNCAMGTMHRRCTASSVRIQREWTAPDYKCVSAGRRIFRRES